MIKVQCSECKKQYEVSPGRKGVTKFCSYACAGKWRSKHFKGSGHPKWQGGKRSKKCPQCGKTYKQQPDETYAFFKVRKFCSKTCSVKGQKYNRGLDHPNYRKDARRKNRGGNHHKWKIAVISRDLATCQHCGISGIELHAHHLKPYKDYPELRFDVSNGITLCFKCHWNIHTVSTANAVNSVNPRPGKAEGNTEPSREGNFAEGVTTRGRAYRRWIGTCAWCQKFLSKPISDIKHVKDKRNITCSKHCHGKWIASTRTYRKWKNPSKAVISSTSAAPERDDIV